MRTIRSRPRLFVLILAPIPLLVTLLGMLAQVGSVSFGKLVSSPEQFLNGAANPWPAILGPLVVSSALLGLFAWLTAALPDSPLLRTRTMRLKRVVTALGALLTGATLWLGILLGDIIWHGALPDVETPASLESSPWLILLAILISSGALFSLVRPTGRKRKKGD